VSQPTADAETAFRALFQATYDDLVCFVERRTHLAIADDVVAEVFLTAWRRFADVPTTLDDARAWLFVTAQHILRNRQRSDQRQRSLALRILREPDGLAAAEADGVATRVDLVRAWQHLSTDDQQALTLTVFENLTGAQAARVLGISRPAFSVRLLRARRRLRRHLQQHEATADHRHPTPTPITETGTPL
jgi:RNA polymerase sigma-70 factor, ECF subfamily